MIFPIEEKGDPWLNYSKQFDSFPKSFPIDPKNCPFVSYYKDKFITPLLFENELARHKLLDFIGDLLYLGRPIKAHFNLTKTGHSFNRRIIKDLYNRYCQS